MATSIAHQTSAAAEIPVLVIAKCREICGAESAVFYGVSDTRATSTAVEQTGALTCPALPRRGPLLRWLRVNGEIVRFPEQSELLNGASDQERAFVAGGNVRAGLPLLVDGRLVGVVFLCDSRTDWQLAPHRAEVLTKNARQWALGWLDATRRQDVLTRSRAEYRSQQLSAAGELAASTAHEIRNPLAAIRSLVQLVRDADTPLDDEKQLLTEVIEEVDRIDRTVGGLLQLSRPHAPRRENVDAGAVVARAVQFIEPYSRRRQITLSAPPHAHVLPVLADPNELRQVFVNVLLNACQACSPGARIHLCIRSEKFDDGRNVVRVSVTDTGHGMSAETLSRIFETFYTTKTDGTGLGLAICRDMVEQHGGTISVASQIGEGTTVTIELPQA